MHRALEQLLIGRAMAGRYLLREVLGRGGMSVVYGAVDQTLGRPVALKLIQQPPGTDHLRDDLRRRFRREAGAAARISPHPNVVRIYDYGTDPELDLDFIVMERLEGRDLAALLRQGPPPRREAVRILLQAALGIAAGHRAGVLHRDIKPGNIFLAAEDSGGVRMLDFGIAKVLEAEGEEDLTVLGLPPHSPSYASPEQLDPTRRLGPPSDVYQLGLVGYEMFAGEKPFTQEEREALRVGRPVPLPVRGRWDDVPGPLRGVIERALLPEPSQRHPDAAAFALALAGAAQAAGELTDTIASSLAAGAVASGLTADLEDRTVAADPAGARDDATLFAPDAAADAGSRARAPVPDETLFAPDHPRYEAAGLGGQAGSPPVAAPKESRAPRRRRIRKKWLWGGAALIVTLAAAAWGATRLLDREAPVRDPAALQLEEEFRELQSEASRELERSGEWER
ncbi:MAG TPA: serine/threonine-protein kinase [Longimicrobiaceae bacterium]